MTKRNPWNKHEAAICLQALIDVIDNKVQRQDAVSDVSAKLRRMAIVNGYKIDDKFRNENGVALQMLHLEYTLTDGKRGLAPSEKWMKNIVSIYREDPLEFNRLVEEGNNVLSINEKKRASFIRWLHKNYSSNADLIESSMTFSDMMLRNSGEIKSSVLEVDNDELLNRILRRIYTKRIFNNSTSRHRAEKYILACKKYNEFIGNKWRRENSEKHEQSVSTYSDNERVKKDRDFYHWMLDEENLSDGTCRSYTSNVHVAEQYAKSHGYESWRLLGVDLDEAKTTASALYRDSNFTKYDIDQHNRFHAAIGKLLEYLGGTNKEISHAIARVSRENESSKVSYEESPAVRSVLKHHFQNGFRVGSVIDTKRFMHFLEIETGRATEIGNDQLNQIIKSCGILYEGRVYLPDSMLSEELRKELFDYIGQRFSDGATMVYYEALFQHFRDEFLDYGIYNADMLKSYIAYYADDRYVLGRSYLSKEYR
jgi:predicted transposase YbfD/YdcC